MTLLCKVLVIKKSYELFSAGHRMLLPCQNFGPGNCFTIYMSYELFSAVLPRHPIPSYGPSIFLIHSPKGIGIKFWAMIPGSSKTLGNDVYADTCCKMQRSG